MAEDRGKRTEETPVEFPWGNPIQPQYHLPELRGGLGKEDGWQRTEQMDGH